MWVKICGITSEEDALTAVGLGADALGFVFAPSPRQVTVGTTRDILRRLPPGVATIGVFRDQSPEFVRDTLLESGLRGAQLHGHETPQMAQDIRSVAQLLLVAFSAGSSSIPRFDEYGADALLLDGTTPGSGEMFDWSLAEDVPSNRRLILAGGLDPDNVGDAVGTVDPWGVDVSTGVESSPGKKDPVKVQRFVKAAKAAAAEGYAAAGPGPFDWNDWGDV